MRKHALKIGATVLGIVSLAGVAGAAATSGSTHPDTHDLADDRGIDAPDTHDLADDKGNDSPDTHDLADDKGNDDPADSGSGHGRDG
jgi:hypothetical protein